MVRRCLSRAPTDRFARTEDLYEALRSARAEVGDASPLDLARAGIGSRGLRDNRADASGSVVIEGSVDEAVQALCFDPQTSGGLLFGVDEDRAGACVADLRARGVPASPVGRVEAGAPCVVLRA